MELGAPDRVNIPCLIHDTRLCQLDVKMTRNQKGKFESFYTSKITTYKSVHSNKVRIGSLLKSILEITDIPIYKIILFRNITMTYHGGL